MATAKEKPSDRVEIVHPKLKHTADNPSRVTRRAFESHLKAKGWELKEDKKGS